MYTIKIFYDVPLLEKFFNEVNNKLIVPGDIVVIKYPKNISKASWENNESEIKKLNINFLKEISKKAGIYGIFTRKSRASNWNLKYIGQSKAIYTTMRLTNHLIKKHAKTGAKLNEVISTVVNGNDVGVKFIQIVPGELRHFVEEKLINYHCKILAWNQRGKNK